MAEVILSYFFKTICTKKPLIDYTMSEKNRFRKWATVHSEYKALSEAFCEIIFQFGDKGADLERGLSLYESSIVPLHDRGSRGTAVVKSRAFLKCLRAPRGHGNSISNFRSRVRASTIRSALDRLHAASAQCAARSGAHELIKYFLQVTTAGRAALAKWDAAQRRQCARGRGRRLEEHPASHASRLSALCAGRRMAARVLGVRPSP